MEAPLVSEVRFPYRFGARLGTQWGGAEVPGSLVLSGIVVSLARRPDLTVPCTMALCCGTMTLAPRVVDVVGFLLVISGRFQPAPVAAAAHPCSSMTFCTMITLICGHWALPVRVTKHHVLHG